MKLLYAVIVILATALAACGQEPHWLRQHFDAGLPVGGSWNTGQGQQLDGQDRGYSPDWQLGQINAGVPILPAFELFHQKLTPNIRASKAAYFEPLWSIARDNKLPLVLIDDNLIFTFHDRAPFHSAVDHPFLVRADGSVLRTASPWSPNVHQWHALGKSIGGYIAAEYAADYPDPPFIYLGDNAEVGVVKFSATAGQGDREDARFPAYLHSAYSLLSGAESEYLHRVEYNRALAIRHAEFKRGLLEVLPAGWQRLRWVAYGSIGPEFGIVSPVKDGNRGYAWPWMSGGPLRFYDGCSNDVGYLHSWSTNMPGIVRSPQMLAGNSLYATAKYRQIVNPAYFVETHFWNGKLVSADVWKGVVRCVLWQTRTQFNRVFLGSAQTVAATYDQQYAPFQAAVNEVASKETLKRFWLGGKLLNNRWTRDFIAEPKDNPNRDISTGYGHPYAGGSDGFMDPGDRLFLQHVPLNKRLIRWREFKPDAPDNRMVDRWVSDRERKCPVPVFAICLQLGDEYLLYAHAPDGAREQVEIHVCPDGPTPRFKVTVDVPVEGRFWRVGSGTTVQEVN